MKPLLPISRKSDTNTLAENIIGFRPDEKWKDAVKRFIMEKRMNKINKILKRKGSN